MNATGPQLLTFYAYRAQDDIEYHTENNNLADLAGVLKYVHYEVVNSQVRDERLGTCMRHYGITRIVRFRLSMFNPPAIFNGFGQLRPQFGPFVAFDQGRCTSCVDQNANIFDHRGGYFVGCQKQKQSTYHYTDNAVWYSLPGRCPSQVWARKTDLCKKLQPGGECEKGRQPDGSPSCTWSIEQMGEVRLDELTGLTNYSQFCKLGYAEFAMTAEGRRSTGGVCFWDGRENDTSNQERIAHVLRAFKRKYPSKPKDMMPPACEF